MRPAQVVLRTFNPVFIVDNDNPSTDTITIEPCGDDDGSGGPVEDDCNACEKSPEANNNKSAKQRSSKRGERAVVELLDCAGGSEESRKKRKIGNLGEFLTLTSGRKVRDCSSENISIDCEKETD